MMKKFSKDMQENISMPFQIKALLKDLPDYEISLIDHDYVGDAKEADFESYANQLYGVFETLPNMMLIIHSNEMTDSRLLRKMFRFDLTEYCFNEKIETLALPINETQIVFLGIISIDTPEYVKDVIKFLFSGIYESGDFIMYSHTPSDIGHIKNLLKKLVTDCNEQTRRHSKGSPFDIIYMPAQKQSENPISLWRNRFRKSYAI